MLRKPIFEPRSTGFSRDDVNQLNKIFETLTKAVNGTSTPAAAPTVSTASSGAVNLGQGTAPVVGAVSGSVNTPLNAASVNTPLNAASVNVDESVNMSTGSAGPSSNSGLVSTDGVTIGGNGVASPIFSFVLSSYLIVTVSFAQSPYSATLEEQQVTYYRCSSSAGADFVFDLPPATGSGYVAVIKKVDANAHNIEVTPFGSDTIDGVNAASNISIQYDFVKLVDVASGAWETTL